MGTLLFIPNFSFEPHENCNCNYYSRSRLRDYSRIRLRIIQLVPAQGLQPESAEGSEPEPHKKRLGSPQHYTDRSIAMRQTHFCWRFCTLAVAILEKLVLLFYTRSHFRPAKTHSDAPKKSRLMVHTVYTRKPVVHTVANAGLLRLKYTATGIF